MANSNPVVIYTATSNLEAHFLCQLLEQNEIEANVEEDSEINGGWAFGSLPQVHRPRIWVDLSVADKARVLVEEFERQQIERQRAADQGDAGSQQIAAECEECGKTADFPASTRGTVQDCPHCGAYLDVGEPENFEE